MISLYPVVRELDIINICHLHFRLFRDTFEEKYEYIAQGVHLPYNPVKWCMPFLFTSA